MLFLQVMLFYALLSFVICPIAGYYIMNESYDYAGYGMTIGCVLSIMLWYKVGKHMVENKQIK